MIERISGRDSFRRFDGARRIRTGLFTVVVADAVGEHPAVAFAVPKRVGGAVHRNRVRRRLREAARAIDRAGRLPRRSYLVVVHRPAAVAGFAELSEALEGAVGRVTDHR